MRVLMVSAVAATLMTGLPAQAMPKPVVPPPVAVAPLPAGANVRPVKLVRANDDQRNLNLFIPIGDALDFLALKTGG